MPNKAIDFIKDINESVAVYYLVGERVYYGALSNIKMKVDFVAPFANSLNSTAVTRWIFKYL
jgi:hypothetical protein